MGDGPPLVVEKWFQMMFGLIMYVDFVNSICKKSFTIKSSIKQDIPIDAAVENKAT